MVERAVEIGKGGLERVPHKASSTASSSGREDRLEPVYERLRQLGIDEPTQVDRTIENLTGRPSRARQSSYRERRKQLLLALLDQYTDEVDRAAEEIGTFFDHLRQVGIRGLVAERLNDGDYVGVGPLDHLDDPKQAAKKRRGD